MLASPNSFHEDVRVQAIIVAELELGNIQREVLLADLVVCANDAAFNQAPEAFDGVGMDRTHDIVSGLMTHGFVRVVFPQAAIGGMFVGVEQGNVSRNNLPHEILESFGAGVFDHASDYVALALDGTDHDALVRAFTTNTALFLIPMAVFVVPTDIGFIDFHDTHELAKFLVDQRGADAMAHAPSGAIAARTDHAVDLKSAYAFLAGQHHVDHTEPFAHRVFGVFEDGADSYGEAVGCSRPGTLVALPIKSAGAVLPDFRIATSGANDALGPTVASEIGFASIVGRERCFPLPDCHLMNALSHAQSPSMRGI